MAGSKAYNLVAKSVPTRQRTSFYKQIIADFEAMKEKSVLVEVPNKKPVTLVQGLRKVLETEGKTDIRVVQRGLETYLIRE